MRKGPKTGDVEEVKKAIRETLEERGELNFTRLFKELRERKIVGNPNILSQTLREMVSQRELTYEEKPWRGPLSAKFYRLNRGVYAKQMIPPNILKFMERNGLTAIDLITSNPPIALAKDVDTGDYTLIFSKPIEVPVEISIPDFTGSKGFNENDSNGSVDYERKLKAQRRLGAIGLPLDFFTFSDMLKEKVGQGQDPREASISILSNGASRELRLHINMDEIFRQINEYIGEAMSKLGIKVRTIVFE